MSETPHGSIVTDEPYDDWYEPSTRRSNVGLEGLADAIRDSHYAHHKGAFQFCNDDVCAAWHQVPA